MIPPDSHRNYPERRQDDHRRSWGDVGLRLAVGIVALMCCAAAYLVGRWAGWW